MEASEALDVAIAAVVLVVALTICTVLIARAVRDRRAAEPERPAWDEGDLVGENRVEGFADRVVIVGGGVGIERFRAKSLERTTRFRYTPEHARDMARWLIEAADRIEGRHVRP